MFNKIVKANLPESPNNSLKFLCGNYMVSPAYAQTIMPPMLTAIRREKKQTELNYQGTCVQFYTLI